MTFQRREKIIALYFKKVMSQKKIELECPFCTTDLEFVYRKIIYFFYFSISFFFTGQGISQLLLSNGEIRNIVAILNTLYDFQIQIASLYSNTDKANR